MPKTWIDSCILDWDIFFSGWRNGDQAEVRRPYEHWHHAERLVEGASSEFQRTDVITTLKRAVDSRLRLLNETYRFRGVPVPGKPDNLLELLGFFGIVRPLLVSELMEVRNRVEHQDAEPPTQSRCRELVEFVWYFIRSTDLLVRQVPDDFDFFDPEDDSYGGTVKVEPHGGWVIHLHSWLRPGLLSATERPDWLVVDVQRTFTWAEQKIRLARQPGAVERTDRDEGDVYVEGRLLGPGVRITELLRRFFERA